MSNIYPFPSENQQASSDLALHRFEVTFFVDRFASVQRREMLTLGELEELILNERGAKKSRLPWLKLAVFGDRRSAKNCLRSNVNLICLTGIEVEHDDGTVTFDAAVELLRQSGLRVLVYTSPSYREGEKEKWRVLAPLSTARPGRDRLHLTARLNGILKGCITVESFNLSQAYLYGRVGDNPGHGTVLLDGDFVDLRADLDIGALGKPTAPRKERVNLPAASGEAWGRSEEEIRALLEKSRQDGHWHNSMLFAIASMVGKRWEDSRIYDACRPYCPLGMTEVEGFIASAREKWKVSNPGVDWSTRLGDVLKELTAVHHMPAPIARPSWREIYPSGNPKASLHNTRLAIETLKIKCSRDMFHGQLWIGHEDSRLPFRGLVSDARIGLLRVHLSNVFGLDFTEKHVRDAVVILCELNRFDPVLDMLSEAEKNWDGVKRLDRMAIEHFNAEDTALNRQMVRKTMIAAVARARVPGCKFDTILTMESEEGWNKSSAWAVLAGEGNFSDVSIIGHHVREVQEALGNIWIHENAELAGMRKAEVEAVKAFASRQNDRARPAYGHFLIDQPRRSIEVATTNGTKYLLSMDGNRRFWPLRTLCPIDLGRLKAARLQLWGEAARRQTAGESLTLDPELWQAARELQETRRALHPWEILLSGLSGTPLPGAFAGIMGLVHRVGNEDRISTLDLFDKVIRVPFAQMNIHHSKTLADVMRKLGWENDVFKMHGKAVRGYTKKVS